MESCTCHFIFLTGSRAGEVAEFTSARLTVGRASIADIQFDPHADLTVASLHAEILYDSGRFILCDLGSRSGTFVNGEPISGPHVLRNDDYIQFGQNGPEIVFRAGPKPAVVVPPKPPVVLGELHFRTGSFAGKRFRITSEKPVTIGRLAQMDIALNPVENIQVSGHHCTIYFTDGRFYVRDHSRNGTFINDSLVKHESVLSDGDVLRLAPGGPVAIFRVIGRVRSYPNKTPREEKPQVHSSEAHANEEKKPTFSKKNPATAENQDAISEFSSVTGAHGSSQAIPKFLTTSEETSINGASIAFPAKRFRLSAKWIALAALAVAVAGPIALVQKYPTILRTWLFRSSDQINSSSIRDYVEQITKGTIWENPEGGYSVVIPREWAKLRNGPMISIESPDKIIAVDYVGDPRLNEETVVQLLRAKGAQPRKVAESYDSQERTITFLGRGGNRVWLAVLRNSSYTPILALFEVNLDYFNLIPNDIYTRLAFETFKPIPTISPSKNGSEEADQQTSAVLPTFGAERRTESSPSAVSEKVSSSPVNVIKGTEETTEPLVVCEAARIGLYLPAGWKARTIPAEGVLLIETAAGLEIRVTRDHNPLMAKAVFEEMQRDGWSPLEKDEIGTALEGTSLKSYTAYMLQNLQHACLGLIDQPDSSTLVVYTQKSNPFSPDQKNEIREALRRLAQFSSAKSH